MYCFKTKMLFVLTIWIVFFIVSVSFSATFQLPFAAYSVDVEDIDLDGDKDIVIGHEVAWEHTNPSISILENNGYGEFDLIDTSMVFSKVRSHHGLVGYCTSSATDSQPPSSLAIIMAQIN